MSLHQTIKKNQDIRIFHIGIGLLLFLQGILIWLLSSNFSLPITSNYLHQDITLGTLSHSTNELFRVEIAHLLVLFLLIAGINHLIVALPNVFINYREFIAKKMNPFRWVEYAITAPIMIIVLALLTGLFDLSALILLATTTAAMIMFGANMELVNHDKTKINWSSFIYGAIIGTVPWLVIWLYISGARGLNLIPAYTIFAFFSVLVFFALFPLNLFLHYKKIGPWKNYEFVETCFILLSLISKSALAWQIFLGLIS